MHAKLAGFWGRALGAAVAIAIVFAAALSQASVHVRVRGTSQIDARVARADGKLVVTGALADDAARPIGRERVTLRVSKSDERGASILFDGAANAVSSCDGEAARAPVLERADLVALRTSDVGRFCVRLALPVDRYALHLAFDGAGGIDGATADVQVDLARKPLALAFDPEPRAIDLDDALRPIEVVATIEENGTTTPGAGLLLLLSNEAGATVGSGTTNGSGRVRFAVLGNALGPPGRGELRVAFSGSAETASASRTVAIERRTHVALAVDGIGADGRLPSGVPEDGVAIEVHARAGALGVVGVIPSGSIEARVGDTIVGAAPLENGAARVVVTFAPPASQDVPIQLRFVPDAPWFERGDDVNVTLPVRGPSPWRHAPLAVAGVLVLAWLALGRTRTVAPSRKKSTAPRAGSPARPKLDVVRAAADHASGWNGYVTDAHEDFGVPNARVAIERAGFERSAVVASADTNERGFFELRHTATQPGDILVIEAPFHAPLRQPVPASGELAIALVQRRRALLERLVGWARSRGRPFDAPPEPTPGHVRRAAGAELAIARWADAVERAAYSGSAVDARAEADVDRLAPDPSASIDASKAAPTIQDAPSMPELPPDGDLDAPAVDALSPGLASGLASKERPRP